MNAWRDSTQHVGIYKVVVKNDEEFKRDFREDLKKHLLEDVVRRYQKEQIGYEEHFELIKNIYNHVHKNYKEKVTFSFGCSQKLVNVFLKYYWCAGKLNGNEPAHMPLDSNILNILKIKDIKWTKMKKNDYDKCIKTAKEKAEVEHLSLAEWELKRFNEIMKK